MSLFRKLTAIVLGAMGWIAGWGLASRLIYPLGRVFFNYSPIQEIPNAFYITQTLKMAVFFSLGFLFAGIFTGLALKLAKPVSSGKQIISVALIWFLSAVIVGGSLITIYRLSHTHPLIDFTYNPVHFFQVFVAPAWMGILGIFGGLGVTWAAGLSDSNSRNIYLINVVFWGSALVLGALVTRAIGRIEIPVMAFQNETVLAVYLIAPALVGGLVSSLIGHTGMVFFGLGKTE